MKTIKTKQDLEQWIIEANNAGYTVPCVNIGAGFSWVSNWEEGCERTGGTLAEDEDYFDEVEYLEKGEEHPEFKRLLSAEEYADMTFVRVNHNTGYNQENFDYQFGIYEY